VTPTCTNCGSNDFVWANEVKTGGSGLMQGSGVLSLRPRGEIPLGTRICRSCGHAELFLRDLKILNSPAHWRPGEFVPITVPSPHKPHHGGHPEPAASSAPLLHPAPTPMVATPVTAPPPPPERAPIAAPVSPYFSSAPTEPTPPRIEPSGVHEIDRSPSPFEERMPRMSEPEPMGHAYDAPASATESHDVPEPEPPKVEVAPPTIKTRAPRKRTSRSKSA
jgi:hypothetical protein